MDHRIGGAIVSATDDPIADRRQRAREAAQDSAQVVQSWAIGAIETGIEVATQVKITSDIIRKFADAYDVSALAAGTAESLKVAFRAAGFEVVE